MEGKRKVSIISHRLVTSSDLKQERSCFRFSVSTFLQLVVACFKEFVGRFKPIRKGKIFCINNDVISLNYIAVSI